MYRGKAIHIGTSGWMYKHWMGAFYPEGTPSSKLLEFYAERFDTVEINNTFYNLPHEKTFMTWKEETPDGFLFAVKANRFITHMKKLSNVEEPLKLFFSRAELLGEKLGPILFQLPPGWNCNFERFAGFLKLLPKAFSYAFEFRNDTWINEQILELLSKNNMAFCIYDLAGTHTGKTVTADFTYIRLHGPEEPYSGKYTDNALSEWAGFIKKQIVTGKKAYCYFDNDQCAFAAQNAKGLKSRLSD